LGFTFFAQAKLGYDLPIYGSHGMTGASQAEMGVLLTFLPKLDSNHHPLYLHFPGSWDYSVSYHTWPH
jgi:hypothetical protein